MPCRGEATNNKVVKTGGKKWPRSSSLTCFPSAGAICIFKNIHFHLRSDSRCQIRPLRVGFENHFRRWRSHVTRPGSEYATIQAASVTLTIRTSYCAIKQSSVPSQNGRSCFRAPVVNAFHMVMRSGSSSRRRRITISGGKTPHLCARGWTNHVKSQPPAWFDRLVRSRLHLCLLPGYI